MAVVASPSARSERRSGWVELGHLVEDLHASWAKSGQVIGYIESQVLLGLGLREAWVGLRSTRLG